MVGEQEEDPVQRHLDKKADLKLQAKSNGDMSPLSLVVMMLLATTKATAIPNSR